MIIVQHGNVGLARDFRESVAYSVGILGDKVANLFYYHARKNYGVDPSQLPQGIDKFDQALRSLIGGGAAIVVRECAKRLAPVLGLRIEHFLDNLASLYRKVSGSRGIMKEDVPSRFARVVGGSSTGFLECSGVVIYRVLRVLYEKYSLPVDFFLSRKFSWIGLRLSGIGLLWIILGPAPLEARTCS